MSAADDNRLWSGNGLFLYPDENWNPVNSIRWELYRETFEDYEYLYLLDDLVARAGRKKLNAAEEKLVREARSFLKESVDAIVPYYEAYDDKEAWKGVKWETDEAKVYEARRRIASYIERLSGIGESR